MKNNKIKIMAYMALYAALYVVLKYVGDFIPFLRMPNGGSIELEFTALFIASYHLGWRRGVLTAMLSWLLTIILGFDRWFVTPIQIILDYAGPLAAAGMASGLWPFKKVSKPAAVLLAVLIASGAYIGITSSWSGNTAAAIGVLLGVSAGLFTYWYVITKKKFGIVIAMVLKYGMQVLSGAYFWFPDGMAAGSTQAWTYSLTYNLWYNLATMIVCIFIVPLLCSRLEKSGITFTA